MDLANIILAFGGLLTIFMALIVFIGNPKNVKNLWLTVFISSTFLWLFTNLLTNISENPSVALIFAQSTLIGATIAPYAFLMFSKVYVGKKLSKKHICLWAILPALILLFTFTPSNVESVEANGKNTVAGLLYYVLLPYFIGYFILGIKVLKRFYKSTSDPRQKTELRYIFTGIILAVLPGVATNGVLPALGFSEAVVYGPFALVFLSIFLTAGIIKHSLLNIRIVVVRSIGYVFSFGFLIIVFALVSSFLTRRVFQDSASDIEAITINTTVFVIAVIAYPGVKRFFDRLTNKIFYRDAYDPQEFLDKLNKTIVNNIEVGILLRRATGVIEENLKCSFVQIIVPSTESTERRVVGNIEKEYSDHDLVYIRGRLVGLGRKIVLADDLGPDEDELRSIFIKHDIALAVHLSATSYGQYQTIAYMIFGNKKSGNVYSKQDLRIIDIMADQLVIAIQNSLRFEEIQAFNVTLQKKVTTATTKLRKNNEKLKSIDATKDEFISMASHQLRTPLTSVKGYLSMVLEGDAGKINDEQRKLLDQAFVSSQRMVYLIADLLNVSRLRTGKFIIDLNETDLAEVIEAEVNQLTEQAKSKNIVLTYDKPNDFPKLTIDETKTRQVVMNFIDNALYYTQSGGKIEVKLNYDKKHVYFRVKDNGLGVPKDEQRHLFEKFYRAKNARSIRPDGTGLGLFMAKKVVTAQSGNILFESKQGKGSTFGFSLPLKDKGKMPKEFQNTDREKAG